MHDEGVCISEEGDDKKASLASLLDSVCRTIDDSQVKTLQNPEVVIFAQQRRSCLNFQQGL